jgi:hypothetical protein
MTIEEIRAELEAIKADPPHDGDAPHRFAAKIIRLFELKVHLAEHLSGKPK